MVTIRSRGATKGLDTTSIRAASSEMRGVVVDEVEVKAGEEAWCSPKRPVNASVSSGISSASAVWRDRPTQPVALVLRSVPFEHRPARDLR